MNFPSNIKFKSVLIGTDINVVSNVEALSGKREIITGEISRKTISLSTVPLSESEDRQFQVFLNSIKYYGEFNLNLSDKGMFKPIVSTTQEEFDIVTASTLNQTQITIEQPDTNNLAIGVGSFVQFNNNATNNVAKKLYQITNITTDFEGVGGLDRYTITLDTPIRTSHTTGDKLYYNNLIGNFLIQEGNVNKSTSVLGATGEQYVTYRFNLIEVL